MVRQAKKPAEAGSNDSRGEEVRDSSAVPGQKCSAQTALFCPVLPLCQCRLCSSSSAFLFVCFHGLPKRAGGFARSHKSFASMQDTRRIPARRTSRERRRI